MCLLALTSLTPMSCAQNVTTWHNDNNRTGWQSQETALYATGTGHVSQTNFGLLWQWPVTGFVFAQPLAVTGVRTNNTNCRPCDLVFVATEEDMLYAFNAASSSSTSVWPPLNLAAYVHGSPVNCNALPPNVPYDPCSKGLLGQYVGVTGTPVIDTTVSPNTLYVVAAVQFTSYCQNQDSICFYLFAVDITTGNVLGTPAVISGIVNGKSPGLPGQCTSDSPAQSQVSFDYNHIQRSALLLLNGKVYVAFAPGGGNEIPNGWMFGYSFSGGSSGTYTQTAVFNSTPYGTGGGFWGSGAGPASDGTYIYAATGNGTIFDVPAQNIPVDIGDSLLKLDPSNNLNVVDYYAPADAGVQRCKNDTDFGSGGVLVVPSTYTYTCTGNCQQCLGPTGCNVVINADKESQLYVANQGNLGKFNASGGNNIQTLLTPHPVVDASQGYWGSPAYWHYNDGQDHYMLYYSATTDQAPLAAPLPINGYSLMTGGTSGPIPDPPSASTETLFCAKSLTPSVSSNSTTAGTGIVWAIEHGNKNNPSLGNCNGAAKQAALHAFNATNLTQELYTSRNLSAGTTGSATTFSTPTIFQGQVYMGTQAGVDVFGLCSSQQGGCLQ